MWGSIAPKILPGCRESFPGFRLSWHRSAVSLCGSRLSLHGPMVHAQLQSEASWLQSKLPWLRSENFYCSSVTLHGSAASTAPGWTFIAPIDPGDPPRLLSEPSLPTWFQNEPPRLWGEPSLSPWLQGEPWLPLVALGWAYKLQWNVKGSDKKLLCLPGFSEIHYIPCNPPPLPIWRWFWGGYYKYCNFLWDHYINRMPNSALISIILNKPSKLLLPVGVNFSSSKNQYFFTPFLVFFFLHRNICFSVCLDFDRQDYPCSM